MDQHQQNLRLLHERLDAFFGRVQARHADRMACGAGCSGCCQQSLSVFAVEMDRIVEAVDALPPAAVERLRARVAAAVAGGRPAEEVPCVLLEDDRCVAYEGRPSICRTHGAPVQLPAEEGGGRDVCPLNFADGGPIDDLPAADVLSLDTVNRTLVAIDQFARFARLAAPHGEPRRDITRTLADHLGVTAC